MGWLDKAQEMASNALGLSSSNNATAASITSIFTDPYNAPAQNWYRALPYGFRFNSRDKQVWTCYLPLAPENLTIRTHFGTNVIPTLYGTIEEHSEQRYYDIVIAGTTGFMPKYYTPFEKTPLTKSKGRGSYKDDKSLVGLDPQLAGGFFQKSIGAVNQGLNTLNSMAENFVGTKVNSGVSPEQSGYMAFHNLYRFLLAYKKDAAGLTSTNKRSTHPLTFLNYKDGQQYDCAIMGFELKRSAAQPQLYNYSITLRAYNLTKIDELDKTSGDLNERLEDLGLAGVDGSLFQKMKQTSNGAKGIIGIVSGGGFGG